MIAQRSHNFRPIDFIIIAGRRVWLETCNQVGALSAPFGRLASAAAHVRRPTLELGQTAARVVRNSERSKGDN